MFYDLNSVSMSTETDDPILVDCDRTTAVYLKQFWDSDLWQASNLDPKKYGIDYILGFRFAVQTIPGKAFGKDVDLPMLTKPISSPSKKKRQKPNGLPSEQRYGFKSKEQYQILTGKIIGYKVYSVPGIAAKSRVETYPEIDQATAKVIKLPSQVELSRYQKKRKKYSAIDNKTLAYPDGQRYAKTKRVSGGRTKIKGSLGDTGIYSSRSYLLDKPKNKLIRDRQQFFIKQGRYIYQRINLQDPILVGRFITVRGSVTVDPIFSLDSQKNIDLWELLRNYGLSKVGSMADKLHPVDIWREQTEQATKRKQLRYEQAIAANERNTTKAITLQAKREFFC